MNGSGPTDAQRRLLAVVAQRLPPERVRELHLFAPIRQGGVETGLAVIAVGEPEPEAAASRFDGAAAGDAAADDALPAADDGVATPDGEAAPSEPADASAIEAAARQEGMPALVLSADDDVVRAVVLAAESATEERADAEAPCDPTDDAAGGVPPVDEEASEVEGTADEAPRLDAVATSDVGDVVDVAVDLAESDDEPTAAPPAAAPARFTIYTARYRLQLKGPDRGKWEAEVVEEADAPLLTVDAVVRGVQRRAGELAEVERLTTADVRRLLAEGA